MSFSPQSVERNFTNDYFFDDITKKEYKYFHGCFFCMNENIELIDWKNDTLELGLVVIQLNISPFFDNPKFPKDLIHDAILEKYPELLL